MNDIQLQKKDSDECLEFAFVSFHIQAGKIVCEMDFVTYDPATEDNIPVEKKTITIQEFAIWLEKEGWIANG